MRNLVILLGVVCLAFMLVPACAPQAEQEAQPVAEEAPSTEADMAALQALVDKEIASINDGDVEALLTLVTEDTVCMPPNEPAIVGKEALQKWGQDLLSQFTIELTGSTEEVQVSGDWALQRYSMTVTMTPTAGGESVQENGKGIHIYERQSDGSWKLARDIWNMDNPPPGEPTT